MTSDDRKLVLIVDADPGFVERARNVVDSHRVLTAGRLEEAQEIVLGGRVDVVVLGPSFGSEHSISEARALVRDGGAPRVVLAADIITNRVLTAALRAGFADVVESPPTAMDLAGVLPQLDQTATDEIAVVIEAPAENPGVMAPPPLHPSQYDPDPAETIGSGSGWMVAEASASSDPSGPRDRAPEQFTSPAPEQRPVGQQDLQPVPEPAPRPILEHPAPTPGAQPLPTPPPEPLLDHPVWPDEAPGALTADDPVRPMTPPPPQPDLRPPAVETHTPVPSGAAVGAAAPPRTAAPAPPPIAPPMAPGGEPTGAIQDIDRIEPQTSSGTGRVIAVMAGKGGSGKSVVATNLAVAIGMRHDPERVAIVDADLQFGDVALMLHIDPVRTLSDVAGYLESLTDARLDAALLRHESGLRVLPAPLAPVKNDEITGKSVVEVVDRLRHLYDTIVVDTGPIFGDDLVTILEHADTMVTVVDMDLPSVKNAKVALDALRSGGFPMERITLVVNRVNSKARLDLVELERSLGLRVGGSVPSDRLVPQSVNEGIPLLALSPRSKVARSFMALAERLDPSADRARLRGGGR